jgi:hypothetical protein
MNKQLHTHIPNFSADTEMIHTSEGVKDQNSTGPGAIFHRGILEWKLRFARKSKKVAMRFEHTQGNLNLNQDRYGVCIHEAGQIAVAFRLYDYEGHPECSVTNDTSGYFNLDFSSLNSSPRYRAVVALAGPVAEFKWSSDHDNFYVWCEKNREHASRRLDWESDLADDMTVALDEARKAEGPEQQLKLLEEWTVATGSLILEMWDEIIQIANDLYDAGYTPRRSKSRAHGD